MNNSLALLKKSLTESIAGLDAVETQANLPQKWSIQEIVEHLVLTYAATNSVITDRLEKGRPTRTRSTLFQHCGRVLVLRLGHFPHGVAAPRAVIPAPIARPLSGRELACKVEHELEALDHALNAASALFGSKRRSVSHVVLGPLSPSQWRRFHVVHGLHHVRQIQTIRTQRSLAP